MRQLWQYVESKPFVDGFHLEAMCDHLEAVSDGRIKRLMINVPPRHTKSLIVDVLWPMWDWLQNPERQWLFASYAHNLTKRDNVRARRLFYSDRYQCLLQEYQPDLVLVGDQNTKVRYDNSQMGYRIATSVSGQLIGEGGDIIVVDDPHNTMEGESELKREACLLWWDEAMSSRLNDPAMGAFVIIMQRLHDQDLCGHIINNAEEYVDWDHVCLPARYERGEDKTRSSIGFEDPRTTEGELLNPGRFDEDSQARLERRMGEYAKAGQQQQRPNPRGGGIFKVEEIAIVPPGTINPNFVEKSVRYWDKAGTKDGGARTAGVLMHLMTSQRIIIEDVVKGQWSYAKREKIIKQTAEMDAVKYGAGTVKVWVEQEPGSGGLESAERTVASLAGHSAYKEPVRGDKETRAEPFSIAVETGTVSCVAGEWVGGDQGYIKELEKFPTGAYKDQVDASSGAYNKLTIAVGGNVGTWGR